MNYTFPNQGMGDYKSPKLKKTLVMSANQKCYYCGSSFTPGSSLHGTYFGVQESKFGDEPLIIETIEMYLKKK